MEEYYSEAQVQQLLFERNLIIMKLKRENEGLKRALEKVIERLSEE